MHVSFEMLVPPGLDKEGNPHLPVEFVRLELDRSNVVVRAATDDDRRKHKRAYKAFLANKGKA